MRTILLTGATGFLGSALAAALAGDGIRLVVLKRRTSDMRALGRLPGVMAYDVEGLDLNRPFGDRAPVDAVVHTATCYGRRGETPAQLAATNVEFPLALLEAAAGHGAPLFVNADTGLADAVSRYARSKREFVERAREASRSRSIGFVNLVLQHMYGPGDDESKFTTWVVRQCLRNAAELPLTPGEQRRDFVYVDDVVSAFVTVLRALSRTTPSYREYEVGTGRAITVREFVETVHRLTGSTTRLDFGALPYRPHEAMLAVADTAALTSLGWSARVSLIEGLTRTIERERQTCVS